MVEHPAHNRQVPGSRPGGPTQFSAAIGLNGSGNGVFFLRRKHSQRLQAGGFRASGDGQTNKRKEGCSIGNAPLFFWSGPQAMISIKRVLHWIDSWAPFRFAESWDNCGLQVGDPESGADRLMVALDPGSRVIAEARELGCQCLVTHHPLLLKPILSVRTDAWPGSVIAGALASGISIIAAHTNLDAAREGTNAQLKRLLELEETGPLDPAALREEDPRYGGIGLVGSLPRALPLGSLGESLRGSLAGAAVRIVGDLQKPVRRVAVCSGSGGSLIDRALAAGADVFVTGDIKYHDGKWAEESGLAIVDIGHFASEKLVLEPLAAYLRSQAEGERAGLEVFLSRSEEDPFHLIV